MGWLWGYSPGSEVWLHSKLLDFSCCTGYNCCIKPDPIMSSKGLLRGRERMEMSLVEKCLGRCITKPEVLLSRLKFLFTHKRARRGTFSGSGRAMSVFPLFSLLPAA